MDESETNSTPPPVERKPNRLKLRLMLAEEEVDIVTADGVEKTFVLVEMTGAQRDAWMNQTATRFKTNEKGHPLGMREFRDLQAGLIAICLKDENRKAVPVSVIQGWPATVQKALYDRCQEMNGLTEKAEETEKNA